MKWTIRKPKHGDTRVVRKFALFPISIRSEDGAIIEIRWLEICYIWQRYDAFYGRWKQSHFVDRVEYEDFKD